MHVEITEPIPYLPVPFSGVPKTVYKWQHLAILASFWNLPSHPSPAATIYFATQILWDWYSKVPSPRIWATPETPALVLSTLHIHAAAACCCCLKKA